MKPVRLALVGFGKWGRNYVQAAKDSGESEVVRVIRRPACREQIERTLRYDKTDKDCKVDAFVIAVHPAAAPELCEIALAGGKPVMVEKPASLSLADAERIADAETKSKAFVMVNHQHLFAEQYERIRGLGTPVNATAVFAGPTERDYSPTWDYGAHAAACLLGLGVNPENFHAGLSKHKYATVVAWHESGVSVYDGYAPAEPPLTRSVRAFARAVRDGGTDDYRFGAHWAVDVARVLESCTSALR